MDSCTFIDPCLNFNWCYMGTLCRWQNETFFKRKEEKQRILTKEQRKKEYKCASHYNIILIRPDLLC